MIKAFSTSATCLVLAGALGLCAWISSHRGSDVVLSSDSDLPPLAVDDVITSFTGIAGISQSATAEYTGDGFDSTDFGEPVEEVSGNSYSHNPGDTIATNTAPVETRPWYDYTVNISLGIDTCDWDESTQPYSCNHNIIDSYKIDITNSDIPPQNGTIYISAEVKEALDYFGKTYSDGCEASYYVYMIYYKDGERIIATEELYKNELARLNDFVCNFKGNGISRMYNFWDWKGTNTIAESIAHITSTPLSASHSLKISLPVKITESQFI